MKKVYWINAIYDAASFVLVGLCVLSVCVLYSLITG